MYVGALCSLRTGQSKINGVRTSTSLRAICHSSLECQTRKLADRPQSHVLFVEY